MRRATVRAVACRSTAITRFRDQFLEIQAALEHGSMASLDGGRTTMNNIEQLFNEPSDTGLASQLSAFWAGFDDVANHPDDTASRTQLLERANTLATELQLGQPAVDAADHEHEERTRRDRRRHQHDWPTRLRSSTSRSRPNTIANLPVNDLEDQRDLLANQLAEASG